MLFFYFQVILLKHFSRISTLGIISVAHDNDCSPPDRQNSSLSKSINRAPQLSWLHLILNSAPQPIPSESYVPSIGCPIISCIQTTTSCQVDVVWCCMQWPFASVAINSSLHFDYIDNKYTCNFHAVLQMWNPKIASFM